MYPDVESSVRLNAMRRAEIREQVLGSYRARQPWVEPTERHARRACPLRKPYASLRAALAHVRVLIPVARPITGPLP